MKATGGKIEIQGEQGTLGEVPLDRLSHDPASPFAVVFPRPQAKSSAGLKGTNLPRPTTKESGTGKPSANGPLAATERAAPKLDLLGTDGKTYRLSDFRGKPVLINLFATWCGPCQMELPRLVDAHHRFSAQGLVILHVSCGEEPGRVEDYARRKRLPFPVLVDPDQAVSNDWRAMAGSGRYGLPTNILLDRDHRVVFSDDGFSEEKFDKIEVAIRRAL